MMIPQAKEPFQFYSRLSLMVMTGLCARNLQELLDHLCKVPESVIYQHTHQFLEQHQHLVPEPPNDFAYWVTHILQDERLGEKMAAIDTVRFNSLEALRQAFISMMELYLKAGGMLRQAPEGKELYLMRAIRFSIPTGIIVHDLNQFVDGLKKVSSSCLYLHMFEAKLRPPLGINDFSDWFETQLGETDLAKKVAGLDPYTQTLEGLRKRIIRFVERRVEKLHRVDS